MTPKRYTQSSPLIQWAYLFEEVRPLQTSTCALFWRATVRTPLLILAPTAVVAIFALVFFMGIAHEVAPEWAHTFTWFYERPHDAREFAERAEGDAQAWWFASTVIVPVVVVGIGGYFLGLWSFLHRLCLPVEIEGGLVEKGSCPGDQCLGRIIVEADGAWRCRKCHGEFIQAAVSPGFTQ